jgi:hypothetical protein
MDEHLTRPPYGIDRLAFLPPPSLRTVWASDRAREVWEPRIRRAARALFDLQWKSVEAGLRRCAMLIIEPGFLATLEDRLKPGRLATTIIRRVPAAPYHGAVREAADNERHQLQIAVGRGGDADALRETLQWDEPGSELSLLGAPECCVEFYRQVWVRDRFADFTWPMAVNTSKPTSDPRTVEVNGPAMCSPFWKWLGVRLTYFSPCRFDCPVARQFAEQILALGDDAHFTEEMEWARVLLSWPAEWSALHGLAEVRHPICKVVISTDPTPTIYRVRVRGDSYPAEGARGLVFPYTG